MRYSMYRLMTTCSEGLPLRAPCARSRHRVCRKNAGAALLSDGLIDARRAEAEIKGQRRALRAFLQGRFGALPEAVEQRIAAADADQLDALAGRVAVIASADEL